MEISAAWLLTIFLAVATITTDASTVSPPIVDSENKTTVESTPKTTPKSNFVDYARPFTNVKDILMQEIQTLDKEATDAKVRFFHMKNIYYFI